MSGLEVVGLLLGAFPLMISAMEHWETTKKVTTSWLRVKRAHRNDLRRLRVCELKFRLQMRDLLEPLVFDETISVVQYQLMLKDCHDPTWNDPDVQEALLHRLAECRDTYIETLQCMSLTITKLAKATMVDDEKFQASLRTQENKVDQSVIRANNAVLVETRRLAYAVGIFKRETLLTEIEGLNETLAAFLTTNDKINDRTTSNELGKSRRAARKYKSLLSFCSYAKSIFRLINEAWKCPCVTEHCANVWLRNQAFQKNVELEMVLRSSAGELARNESPWSQQPLRVGLDESLSVQQPRKSTVRWQTPSDIVPSPQSQAAEPVMTRDVDAHGLCKLSSMSCQTDGCLGFLKDSETGDTYHLFEVSTRHEYTQLVSLADILGRKVPASLFRIGRWTMAYSLACSFVRLSTTPWLPEPATDLSQILVPLDPGCEYRVLYDRAYLVARFGPPKSCNSSPLGSHPSSTPFTDSAFVELGILLLELCFTRPISEHSRWQDPDMKSLPASNPFVRKMVASEWAKDVQLEADQDYAAAVDWCLHRATVKSDKWRDEMAEHVVQPLQRCWEAASKAAGNVV